MHESINNIIKTYTEEDGDFYLCGSTWPVLDVTKILKETINKQAVRAGKQVVSRKEIEKLKDAGRYFLWI